MAKDKNLDLIKLGDEITLLRYERDLSQLEFTAKIGMNRTYYGGVERGERNITVLNLIRIAIGLGVAPGELFKRLS